MSHGGNTESLTRLLVDAREGDTQAFRHLCSKHSTHRWLLAITCSLPKRLRAKVDPEDVLIDVLQNAWEGLNRLDDVSTQGFHRWVSGILRHRVTDVIRHHDRSKRDVRREQAFPDTSCGAWLRLEGSPGSSAIRREELERVAELVSSLKESYRNVIIYRVLEGRRTSEVAKLLSMTSNNVSVTLRRALSSLAERMKECGLDSTVTI